MGKVVEIATRIESGAPMVVYASTKVSFDHGIGDDSRGLIKGDRQVTVMTKENWDIVCSELGRKLHWTTRRANILIEGIDLKESKGLILKIGNFYLEITGELVPCQLMDDQILGLKNALIPDWRGGVMCKILSEGMVKENDRVVVMERE